MAENGSIYWNYIIFCVLYSSAHGAVDSVLAYSTAELGNVVGSNGASTLYMFYTASALLLAKPILRYHGPKNTIFFGLCGMQVYVASFFLAIQSPKYAGYVFTTGGALGGIGAGLLWPAQGAYFSISARKYASLSNINEAFAIAKFAAIFAAVYLGLETALKLLATLIYLGAGTNSSWHLIVFGTYTIGAYFSVIGFGIFVSQVTVYKDIIESTVKKSNNEDSRKSYPFSILSDDSEGLEEIGTEEFPTENRNNHVPNIKNVLVTDSYSYVSMKKDILSVANAIKRVRLLQLMIPYQISFGFSSGFVGFYVYKNVVAMNIGDGYIGLLSALSTFTAVLIAYPIEIVSKQFLGRGKWYVMIFGALCFCFTGLSLLLLSDDELSKWHFIIIYFILHGTARGCWENTNKAVIAEYFATDDTRETAFATVYFTSGLSGAIGFFCYKFMTRSEMALFNTIIPLIALICYHKSEKMFFSSKSTNDHIITTAENVISVGL